MIRRMCFSRTILTVVPPQAARKQDEPPDGGPKEDGDAAIRDGAPGRIYDAPKTARQTEQKQNPTRPSLSTPSARTEATEASQPPWKQKRPRRAFAGDVAMAELRNDLVEMSELPDQSPEPPTSAVFGAKVLIVVATAAAAGAVAYLWSSPNADRMDVASAARELPAPLEQPQLPATRVVPAPTAQPSPAPVSALRSFFSQSNEASSRERARQLTIKAARLWQVDAPARLIASPVDDSWDVDVVISGLVSGSSVSVGTPARPNGCGVPVGDRTGAGTPGS